MLQAIQEPQGEDVNHKKAREWLVASDQDFGVWFNDRVILFVREGTLFGCSRNTGKDLGYPFFNVDHLLKVAGVDPNEIGEAY